MRLFYSFICGGLLTLLTGTSMMAQSTDSTKKDKLSWLSIKGYTQIRYNELFDGDSKVECEQCDKSLGTDKGLFVRRLRFSIEAQILPRLTFTIQPDISGILEGGDVVQLRDFYFEYKLDQDEEFRIKVGQTRIPYGYENLQSSRERIPFDRNDGVNSAFINERDWGVFLFYTPKHLQAHFDAQKKNNRRGAGDYGLVSIGAFQGQSTLKDHNNNKHVVARVAYPFQVSNQMFETAVQAYTGRYSMVKDKLTDGIFTVPGARFKDERVGFSAVMFANPIGIQAEYNWGTGPQFDPTSGSVTQQKLKGGYTMVNYKLPIRGHTLLPYIRVQQYEGGKKHEQDARRHLVRELEAGMEWQINKYVDILAAYSTSDRTFEDFKRPNYTQTGSMLRLQLQVGF